jgi:sugar phosphate isomerase/epimerase
MDLLLFAKHLASTGDLSLTEAADLAGDLDVDGVDLTVRTGGYVDPAAVETALPRAVETFADRGLSVPMITTRIREPTDEAAAVVAAADEAGVSVLKLGYWPYEGLGSLAAGRAAMTEDLAAVGALAADYEVTPAVHVHSGANLSASGVLLAEVLSDVDGVAAYPDLGHLGAEGAVDGWRIGLDALTPHAATVGVKNYDWERRDGEWRRRPVGLAEGIVDVPAALAHLGTSGFDGPLSLHAEYGADRDALVSGIERDVAFLREVMGS